jgi:hypothetical protein
MKENKMDWITNTNINKAMKIYNIIILFFIIINCFSCSIKNIKESDNDLKSNTLNGVFYNYYEDKDIVFYDFQINKTYKILILNIGNNLDTIVVKYSNYGNWTMLDNKLIIKTHDYSEFSPIISFYDRFHYDIDTLYIYNNMEIGFDSIFNKNNEKFYFKNIDR